MPNAAALRATIDNNAFIGRNKGRIFRHNTDNSLVILMEGAISESGTGNPLRVFYVTTGMPGLPVHLSSTIAEFRTNYTRVTQGAPTIVADADTAPE